MFNGNQSMKVKLWKNSTLKYVIEYLRCLKILELQDKGQNGLERMSGKDC